MKRRASITRCSGSPQDTQNIVTNRGNILMKNLKILAVTASAVILAACGGGGGGGGDNTTPNTPNAVLNSATQDVAAQEVTSTAFLPLLTSELLVGAQTTDERVLFQFAKTQLARLPDYLRSGRSGNALTGVGQTETLNCVAGGTLTISSDTANPNGVAAAGDSATITGNNCREMEDTINGTLRIVINSLSGDLDSTQYNASMTMSFEALSVQNPQYHASLNGPLTLVIAATGANQSTQSFTTPSLAVSATYANQTRTRTMTQFQATATRTPDPQYAYVTSYQVSGSVNSSALSSQTLSFDTSSPFVVRSDDSYPYSGVMRVLGATNAQLRLTAISNSQVRQELDAGGDGTFEESKTVSWAALL
jgi:hypothetical protein